MFKSGDQPEGSAEDSGHEKTRNAGEIANSVHDVQRENLISFTNNLRSKFGLKKIQLGNKFG